MNKQHETTPLPQDAAAQSRTPEEKILVLRDYCTRPLGSECARCALACPHQAIDYTEEELPRIDHQLCTQCGICFGICDAFSSNRVTLLDLHQRVKRIALQGDTVYFTCQENIFPGLTPASSVIVLPCLACLPPEFWVLVLSENIPLSIACDLSYCSDCNRAGETAEELYSYVIALAEKWSGKTITFSEIIPEKNTLVAELNSPQGIDRRNAFTNLADDVIDIASGKRRMRNSEVLQQFLERRERSRALAQLNLNEKDELNDFAPQGRTKKTMVPKRRMLLEALNRDPSMASRIPLYVVDINRDLCKNTLSCVGVCPTGALSPDPETATISLESRYCIGCGLCVNACPLGALELVETTAESLLSKEEETSAKPFDSK